MFKKLPSAEYIQECFDYDAKTGKMIWRERPENHFKSNRIWLSFNAKHAGKEAFTTADSFRYRRGKINGSDYLIQRVIWKYMTGKDPDGEVDHINGVRDDNRWENLRCVSHSVNMQNSRKRADNTTGICGVTIKNGRFCARVQANGRRHHLGYFNTLQGAERAMMAGREKFGMHPNHGADRL